MRCNENINKVIVLFNSELPKLVDPSNGGQLPGSKSLLVDSYQISNDLYMNGINNDNYLSIFMLITLSIIMNRYSLLTNGVVVMMIKT